ncbi:MbcA/ParS/Xre antitoxin family protein [Granulosicoccaceae sp. 1_MG-2023]|nr:MbcA/ParS/Xre antitoxin family protein [Granulosicoccaceae sp. 1_MG-2023]
MNSTTLNKLGDDRTLIAKAVLNAASYLGLTRNELGEIIGRHRSSLGKGIDPDSKEGELALMLIRCYRSLFALMDGDRDNIRHWMHTANQGTGGVPAEQIKTIPGLSRVMTYLDAIRGKL